MKFRPFKVLKKAIDSIPLQNIIMFESFPDFSGSSEALFGELIKRGLNKKYIMVWKLSSPQHDFPHYKNVYYVYNKNILKLFQHLAKLFISENRYFGRERPKGQYLFHILHGGSIKDVRSHYHAPTDIDEVITLSSYLLPTDAENFGICPEKMNPLGYPRNDVLLEKRIDQHNLFCEHSFETLIYWLPTYRQHKSVSELNCSNISIPIIHNAENARRVNDVAKKKNSLIVVKPHFAQDVSYIKNLHLSNLVLIDDQFLADHKVRNYELLNSADALLSDYSSVYYDYLLTSRPIGLCWEDIEEYRRKEGFIIDPGVLMAGGEKIYNVDELCSFIERIADGKDVLFAEREQLKNKIFPDGGKPCTGKVADRVETILLQL